MIKALFIALITILIGHICLISVTYAEKSAGLNLTGNLLFGYRSVKVDGSENKYREDVDLDSGFRLFTLNLKGRPQQSRMLDRFDLRLDNVGGDPFIGHNLIIEKARLYKLEIDFKRMDYFYNASNDLHTVDFERRTGEIRLIINPVNLPKLTFSYSRTDREGTLLTSRPLSFFPTGLFQVDAPLDDVTTHYSGAIEFSLGPLDIFLEQSFKKYESEQRLVRPVSSNLAVGQPGINVAQFNWNQFENIDQPVSRLKLHSKPIKRLDLSGSLLYSKAEMDLTLNSQQVINNVLSTADGSGGSHKKISIVDLEGTYDLTRRLRIHGLGQWSRLKQDGDLTIQDTAAGSVINFAVAGEVINHVIKTQKFGFQLEYFPLDTLNLFTGIERQQREVDLSQQVAFEDRELTSDNTVLLFGFNFKPLSSLDMYGRFQRGELDNPLTNISPTDDENIKIRLRYRPRNNFSLVGTFTSKTTRNSDSGATAHLKSTGLSLWYQPLKRFDISLGYTKQAGRIFNLFSPLVLISDLTTGRAEYTADTNILTAAINYFLTKELKIGVDYQLIDSEGSLALENSSLAFTASYLWHKNVETKLRYQMIDYDLSLRDIEDYTARIVTLSVGVVF